MFAVIVVWLAILGVLWYIGDVIQLQTFSLVAAGFALGMFAMYIAMHIYSWE